MNLPNVNMTIYLITYIYLRQEMNIHEAVYFL